jgi:hypothetical protein
MQSAAAEGAGWEQKAPSSPPLVDAPDPDPPLKSSTIFFSSFSSSFAAAPAEAEPDADGCWKEKDRKEEAKWPSGPKAGVAGAWRCGMEGIFGVRAPGPVRRRGGRLESSSE